MNKKQIFLLLAFSVIMFFSLCSVSVNNLKPLMLLLVLYLIQVPQGVLFFLSLHIVGKAGWVDNIIPIGRTLAIYSMAASLVFFILLPLILPLYPWYWKGTVFSNGFKNVYFHFPYIINRIILLSMGWFGFSYWYVLITEHVSSGLLTWCLKICNLDNALRKIEMHYICTLCN